jgi:predicted RNA-binding Zn-ribbon protein involved in translation (DUF1610 family)
VNPLAKSAYDDPAVLKFLDSLVKEGMLELKPTLGANGVHYVEAEKMLGNRMPRDIDGWLETMAEQGILERRFLERMLLCPTCRASDVRSKYTCKLGASANVEHIELVEHVKCGYMGCGKDFKKASQPICPGCSVEMVERDVDFKVVGECYECEQCGHRFDAPNVVHFCGHCNEVFTYHEAIYTKPVAYRISENSLTKIGAGVPYLTTIRSILGEYPFDVRFRETIRGSSGVLHGFDVVAERDNLRLVIDVSPVGREEDLLRLLGKRIDVQPTGCLLIVMSNSEAVASLSKVYGVTVISAASEDELETNLKTFLEQFISPPEIQKSLHK